MLFDCEGVTVWSFQLLVGAQDHCANHDYSLRKAGAYPSGKSVAEYYLCSLPHIGGISRNSGFTDTFWILIKSDICPARS